MQSTCHSQ